MHTKRDSIQVQGAVASCVLFIMGGHRSLSTPVLVMIILVTGVLSSELLDKHSLFYMVCRLFQNYSYI